MSENKCQYRYEGVNIVIVPFTSTEESLKNFEKSIGQISNSNKEDDILLKNSSESCTTTCTSSAAEKCDKIKTPILATKCSFDEISNVPEESNNEDKTPDPKIKEINSNKVNMNTLSQSLSSNNYRTTCTRSTAEKCDKIKTPIPEAKCSFKISNVPDESNNEGVYLPTPKIWDININKVMNTLPQSLSSNNVINTEQSGAPIQAIKGSRCNDDTVLQVNKSQEFGYFNNAERQHQAIKVITPDTKVEDANITSPQSWASNYMMNIGNLYSRPVKLNLSLNKNKTKKEDNIFEKIPLKETEKPESSIKLDSSSKVTVFNKVHINKNNIINTDVKMSKKVITKKSNLKEDKNKPISFNKNKSDLITDKSNNPRCMKTKVSKYYIPLEKKPKASKEDEITNSKSSKSNKESSFKASTIGQYKPKPSTSQTHKNNKNVEQAPQKKIRKETQHTSHSRCDKEITSSSSKPHSNIYKYDNNKCNDHKKTVTHHRDSENKNEMVKRRRCSNREDARKLKSKEVENASFTKRSKRRTNRIYESDISEDEVPKTIKSIVNDVREISKQNVENTSNLNKFTDLREKLSSKYSKSLSDYIKQRQEKMTKLSKENELTSNKHELNNLVISVPNKTDDIKSTDLSSPSKRKKSPKAKKSKKIKLIIKLVCDDDSSSSSSENETKNYNKNEPSNTDLSFLDDFNIDEIVECLNSSKSPIKHHNNIDKNSIIKTSNDIIINTFDGIDSIYDEDTMDLNDYNENCTSFTDYSFSQRLFEANSTTSYEKQQIDDFRYKAKSNPLLCPQENNNNNISVGLDIKKEANVDNNTHALIIKSEEDIVIDTELKMEPMELNYIENLQIKTEPNHNINCLLKESEIIVIDDEELDVGSNKTQNDFETIVIDDDISDFDGKTIKEEVVVVEENGKIDVLGIDTNNKENTNATEDHIEVGQTDSAIANTDKIYSVNTIQNIEIKQETDQDFKEISKNSFVEVGTEVKFSKNEEQNLTSIASQSLQEPVHIASGDNNDSDKNNSTKNKPEKLDVTAENKDDEIDNNIMQDESDKPEKDNKEVNVTESVKAQVKNISEINVNPTNLDVKIVNKNKDIDSKKYENSQDINKLQISTNVEEPAKMSVINSSIDSADKPNSENKKCVKNDDNSTQNNNDDSKNKLQKSIHFVAKPVDILAANSYDNANNTNEKSKFALLEQKMLNYTKEPYKIWSEFHTGAYSKIFSCKNEEGKLYAIKKLKFYKSENGLDSMLKKIQTDVLKEDLNVVFVYHSFDFHRHRYLIMDYYPRNLKYALDRSKKGIHINLVYILAKQLASALLMLKKNKIVHSDIHPRHILLNSSNNKLKLCGFDGAYYITDEVRFPNIGQLNYKAPEVLIGYSSGYEIDVWAMALVIYEMITKGRSLFQATSNNTLLFQQMRAMGKMPRDMITNGRYSYQHFDGYSFNYYIKKIENFFPSGRLSSHMHGAYKNFWSKFYYNHEGKLRKLISMLTSMLDLHPNYRLNIEFICEHILKDEVDA